MFLHQKDVFFEYIFCFIILVAYKLFTFLYYKLNKIRKHLLKNFLVYILNISIFYCVTIFDLTDEIYYSFYQESLNLIF